MTDHVVKEGECISSIAFQYGFFPDTLWNSGPLAGLKALRKDPNVLLPGDVVPIPDKRQELVSAAMGSRHVFRRRGVPARFRLQLWGVEEPLANTAYELIVDGKSMKGVTNGQGVLEADIPPDAKEGELIIGEEKDSYPLKFGFLNPITENKGIQDRLRNLGFYDGEPNGEKDDRMKAALLRFQRRFSIKETGEADADTLSQLDTLHDSVKPLPPPAANAFNELIDATNDLTGTND